MPTNFTRFDVTVDDDDLVPQLPLTTEADLAELRASVAQLQRQVATLQARRDRDLLQAQLSRMDRRQRAERCLAALEARTLRTRGGRS